MKRDQFNQLLSDPATISLNFISDLEEITRRFPYFTNAHLLLAKQYHGHENIRYDSYLKKASVYAPDRAVLYELINRKTGKVIHMTTPAETETEEVIATSPEAPQELRVSESYTPEVPEESNHLSAPSEIAESVAPSPVSEPGPLPSDSEKENTAASFTGTTDERLSVIEKRLREIESQKSEATSSGPAVTPDTPSAPPPAAPVARETEPQESATVSDSVSEHTLPTEVAVPPAPVAAEKKQSPQNDTHSFSEWLKIKSIPVLPAERIGEYNILDKTSDQESQPSVSQDDLLDKFIRNEPRIVPKKAEFYSPGNMARKSAMEHEDLISETLARIYAQQGNISKAIDAYQRLSLKNPEKSAYFAALIRELEEGSAD